jgi:hypothetical protein
MLTIKFPHWRVAAESGITMLYPEPVAAPWARRCTLARRYTSSPPLMAVRNPNTLTRRRAGDIDGPHNQGG